MKKLRKEIPDLDIVVNPRPLTAKDITAISEYIKKDKLKRQENQKAQVSKDNAGRTSRRLTKVREKI